MPTPQDIDKKVALMTLEELELIRKRKLGSSYLIIVLSYVSIFFVLGLNNKNYIALFFFLGFISLVLLILYFREKQNYLAKILRQHFLEAFVYQYNSNFRYQATIQESIKDFRSIKLKNDSTYAFYDVWGVLKAEDYIFGTIDSISVECCNIVLVSADNNFPKETSGILLKFSGFSNKVSLQKLTQKFELVKFCEQLQQGIKSLHTPYWTTNGQEGQIFLFIPSNRMLFNIRSDERFTSNILHQALAAELKLIKEATEVLKKALPSI